MYRGAQLQLFYVAEISIEPEFRCMGLGSTLLSKIAVMMDLSNSMVALKAFPLMFKYAASSGADEIDRVKRFYEKHGFKHVGGDSWPGCSASKKTCFSVNVFRRPDGRAVAAVLDKRDTFAKLRGRGLFRLNLELTNR
jgi:hypothetical protein